MPEAKRIEVAWGRPTWSSWFRYQRGVWLNASVAGPWIEDLWRHVRTGQVRIYSDDDWEGRRVSFNGGPEMVMRARGRHGRLYLSVDPREGV